MRSRQLGHCKQPTVTKLEHSRVHTPCVLSICRSRSLHRDRPIMLNNLYQPSSGHGRWVWCYDGRQNDAISDVRGPCLMIRSTFKPVCTSLILTDWLRLRVAQVPRCRDLAIFVVTTDGKMDRWTDYPCTCARGNNDQFLMNR